MKISKITMSAAAAVLALTLISRAGDTPTANPFLAVLSTITQAELPAKAADLVAQADAKHQQQTTIDVVKAAVGLNPAAAAVIVGSIAQKTPAMAAIAASTAAGLVPDQAVAIARAAAAAAPRQAGKIVEAICRVLPTAYAEIAGAVADVVPGAGKEILAGVSAGIPALKGPIDNILLAGKGSVPSVNTVLDQVKITESPGSLEPAAGGTIPGGTVPAPTISSALVHPVVNPPYVVPPPSPVNYGSPGSPGNSGQVPPGGRITTPP
jgi:Meckel syndrome type 1 protein